MVAIFYFEICVSALLNTKMPFILFYFYVVLFYFDACCSAAAASSFKWHVFFIWFSDFKFFFQLFTLIYNSLFSHYHYVYLQAPTNIKYHHPFLCYCFWLLLLLFF